MTLVIAIFDAGEPLKKEQEKDANALPCRLPRKNDTGREDELLGTYCGLRVFNIGKFGAVFATKEQLKTATEDFVRKVSSQTVLLC